MMAPTEKLAGASQKRQVLCRTPNLPGIAHFVTSGGIGLAPTVGCTRETRPFRLVRVRGVAMTTRGGWSRGLAFAAVAGLVLIGALRGESIPKADENKNIRKQALELNEITGAAPLAGKLKQLRGSPAKTLQLLKVAAKMSKEKDQPFNRNATMLLAMAAEQSREVDISASFYKLNAEQSLKLLSEKGLAMAYLGLVQLYSNNRRNAECE